MVKRLFGILHIVLITAIVFCGVTLFYGIVESRLEEAILLAELKKNAAYQDPTGSQTGIGMSAERGFSEYQAIARRDLFRTKAADTDTPTTVETNVEELEKTKLKLKLWGTITGDAGGAAYAVIEDASKRQRAQQHLYREGDRVGEADVKLILREKVVLTVNGKDEVLEMEQLLDESGTASTPGARSFDSAPATISESQGDISITRDTIEDALSDVGNLMRQVRIRPFFKDGNPEGILLSGIRRGSIFEEMGLNSGDVITGVNGEPIRTVEDAMQLYEGLKSERSVEVQIERNGAAQTISYRID
ncbi:MAG: type II secretion system protein GspC [Thermodesulfobacteriota bacterium]